jgi:hypothetical protein
MADSASKLVGRLDRMLVGVLWGAHGLDRGYSLFPRLTAIGLGFAGLATMALLAQAILLPQHRPWPVKLIALLNFAALVAGVACYRNGWWSGLRAILVAIAIYTLGIYAFSWLGGFVPRLSHSQVIRVAKDAVTAAGGNTRGPNEPDVVLYTDGGRGPFLWAVEFRPAGPGKAIVVKVEDATGAAEIARAVEPRNAADSR